MGYRLCKHHEDIGYEDAHVAVTAFLKSLKVLVQKSFPLPLRLDAERRLISL